ncbi:MULTISPECIES: FtsX-like permease family protein [unclassified Pseudoalteromonas]|uniref:ABC transporter permease n=1 Tax=unclassified Pseudoalteromonas TaxID=194690 RepID=UPI002097A601|nr:FtsX-like permease family protein [Pseudoalteromonas sp. XMcav2-N]MCO7189406.1 ABC transporter permease [Pseudoalteromonas sp. XMcav2-N]
MRLVTLATKSMLNRKASVLLTLFTIAISVMLLLSIERVRQEAKSSFSNTVSGTDLIVGARSGDIQLLLSSVFRIGHANNSVSWASYQDIKAQRGVSWAIPISLGDSHKGHAVLGTDSAYFTHFRYGKKQNLAFAAGRAFVNAQEVVLGSEVASKMHYRLGQQIVISHGMGNTSFHHHDDNPMTIVGILAPTGTPVDKTVHVPLAAIEAMHSQPKSAPRMIGKPKQSTDHDDTHEHNHSHDHGHADEHKHNGSHDHADEHGHNDDHGHTDEHNHGHEQPDTVAVAVPAPAHLHGDLIGEPKQITAFLMGLDSPLYTLQIRRNINNYKAEPLLAIMPGVTLRELWRMLGLVEKILLLFSGVVVLISLLGMLTTLLATLNQRRRELAILRSVGARPRHIFTLMSSEAILITAAGCALGIALFYALIALAQGTLQSQFGISLSISLLSHYELMLIGVIMAAGTLMGILPATRAYFYSLSDGMSIKL